MMQLAALGISAFGTLMPTGAFHSEYPCYPIAALESAFAADGREVGVRIISAQGDVVELWLDPVGTVWLVLSVRAIDMACIIGDGVME